MLEIHDVCPLMLIVSIIQRHATNALIHNVTALDFREHFSGVSCEAWELRFIFFANVRGQATPSQGLKTA